MIDRLVGPNNKFVAGTSVSIRLVASTTGEGAGSDPSTYRTIQGVYTAVLADELLAVDLEPNDAIPSPANTYYVIETRSPGRPKVVRTFTAPAAPAATVVDGDQAAAGSTLTVASTTGFDASGLLYVGGQVLAYTATTGTTFTGMTGWTAALDDAAAVEQAYWIPAHLVVPSDLLDVIDGGTP